MTSRLSQAHCRPRLDAAPTPLLSSYAKRYNQQKWKGRVFPNGEALCNDVFLNTIADLKAMGIEHEDFEKAEAFFRN